MRDQFSRIIMTTLLAAVCASCTPLTAVNPGDPTSGAPMGSTGTDKKRIYITDRRGERFDVTHAVKAYGMSRRGFEHGIGKHAIKPINSPNMIAAGHPSFPVAWDDSPIIGKRIEGEDRGYPIRLLRRHEIVNEVVGQTHAAVAY